MACDNLVNHFGGAATAVSDLFSCTWRKSRHWGSLKLVLASWTDVLLCLFLHMHTSLFLSHSLTTSSSLSTGQWTLWADLPSTPCEMPRAQRKPDQPLFQKARQALDNKFSVIHSRTLWSCNSYYYSHNSKDY